MGFGASKKYMDALIALVLIIILVFLVGIVVGVFGIATQQVNASLVNASSANSLAVQNYNKVLAIQSTIIPFITVVVIIALIVVLLDLFGIADIFNFNR